MRIPVKRRGGGYASPGESEKKTRGHRGRLDTAATLALLTLGLSLSTVQQASAQGAPNFGPNVYIIDSSMSSTAIQNTLNTLNQEAQFSTNRYAVFFMPGTYSGISAQIGYYESVAGLGQAPQDVTINGSLGTNLTDPNGNVTVNFWRSLENIQINDASTLQWAVSQGADFRRVYVSGALELTNTSCGQASGGFMADSIVAGNVNSCSQQQWFTRNSSIGSWSGNLWNMVFSGVQGAPVPNYPTKSYTVLPSTPVSREKPYLYVDDGGNYNVFVPAPQTNSAGASWAAGATPGYAIPIARFFIATPSTALADINAALAYGQNLILTPGIYQYADAIKVTNPNTIVLGLGYATVVPQAGTAAITVADVDGVQVAGLIIDAGPVNSPVLLQVGAAGASGASHQANPTTISDLSFRIGGATAGAASTSMEIDSNNVILDNIWAWRADHGNGFGWSTNVANHGVVVNGNNVTALGLAVEHYQQNQVLWNGNGGTTIFYQSELPYDVPSQAAWMNGAANGYASYAVSNGVTTHTAYGMGVYSFFNQGVNIVEDSAITVPNAAGVTVTDAVSVFLSGSGSISATVNSAGTPVRSGSITSYLPFYQGVPCSSTCPAVPAGVAASPISPSQINLNWTASAGSGVTYSVFRSTAYGFTPSSANRVASGLTGTAYADTTLASATAYYYVVQASSSAGASAYSDQVSAATPASVITHTLVAIDAGYTGSSPPAGWSADMDLNTSGTTASSVTSGIAIPLAVSNAAPNIVPAVFQSYRHGNSFTYTIPGQTPGAVYIVDLLFAENYSGGNKVGYREFNVAINGTPVLTNFDIYATTGALNTATVQSFYAVADASGNITIAFTSGAANSPTVNGILIGTGSSQLVIPGAASGLTASAVSDSQIDLAWDASATPDVQYEVYRGTTAGFTPAPANLIATTTGTTYADSTAFPATTYYYVVQANNGVFTSSSSNQASAMSDSVPQPSPGAPVAPTALAASAVSSSQVNLLWVGSATPQVEYEVFRSTSAGFTPSAGNLIATIPATGYADTGLVAGTTYYYVVAAVNTVGASPASSQASATTAAGQQQSVGFTLPASATYGAAPIALSATATSGLAVSFSATGPATVSGNTLVVTGAGTVNVTATQAGNGSYGAAAPVSRTLAVAPAPLVVSANNASSTVGAVPVLSASYAGFVNGDTAAVLGGAPALSTTASAASPAGTYPITAARGTLSMANYAPSFVNGTLSVLAAPATGSATLAASTALVKVAGGYQASITVANSGSGAAANVTLGTATLGSATAAALPLNIGTIAAGGSATVTVTFPLSAGNDGATVALRLAGSYTGGTFTVGARAVLP